MSRNYYPSSTRDDLPPLREVVGDVLDRHPPPSADHARGGDDRAQMMRPGSSKYHLPPLQQRTLPPITLNEPPVLPPIRHHSDVALPPLHNERGGGSRHTLPPIRSSGAGRGERERGPTLAPFRYTTPEPIMRSSPYRHQNIPSSSTRSPEPPPRPPPAPPTHTRRPASALSRHHERTTTRQDASSSKSPYYQQQPPVVVERRRAATPAPPPPPPPPTGVSRRDVPPVKPPSFAPIRPRMATTTATATAPATTAAITTSAPATTGPMTTSVATSARPYPPNPPGTIIAGTLEQPPTPPLVPTTLPHPYHNPILPQPSSGPVKYTFTVMRPQQGDLVDVRTPSEKPQGILRPTAIIEDEDDSHKRYPCNWPGCGKKYDRPSSLEVHRHSHTGTQPYPCEWPGCKRAFGVKSNMLRHYRSHDPGNRPTERIDMAAPSSSSDARFFHKSSSQKQKAGQASTAEASSSSNPGETAIADEECAPARSNAHYR